MKLSTGVYKLVFHTGEYFSKQGVQTLYPFVEVRPSLMRYGTLPDKIDHIQLLGSIPTLSYSLISQSMELHHLPRELDILEYIDN